MVIRKIIQFQTGANIIIKSDYTRYGMWYSSLKYFTFPVVKSTIDEQLILQHRQHLGLALPVLKNNWSTIIGCNVAADMPTLKYRLSSDNL